jgi:GDP/UDP-N,N'-diacetylbacillosamine 2-epimerase (hydrolysing)
MKPKIDYLFVLGSRGEWGYIRPIIDYCIKKKKKYGICLTNMVVISEYGENGISLGKKIIDEGYNIIDNIEMSIEGHTHFTMVKSLHLFGLNFVETVKRLNPKFVILAGDRGEQLVSAITSAYCYIPVAHIQAGEKSGNIDGTTRHGIARFSHIHFASNKDAYDRLVNSGEEKFRIFNVGAPQLDEIKSKRFYPKKYLLDNFKFIDLSNFFLVAFHPVTEEYLQTKKNINNLIKALKKFKTQKIWILPNNDAGSNIVKEQILRNRDNNTFIFTNLKREVYFSLLNHCKLLIGNSSSGIIESPSFNKYSINIGNRQNERFQSNMTLNCGYGFEDIQKTIQKGLKSRRRKKILNPYGDGNSSEKIIKILERIKIGKKLIEKKLTI